MLSQHFNASDPSLHVRQKTPSTDLCYKSDISSLMVFTSPDSSLDRASLALSVQPSFKPCALSVGHWDCFRMPAY
ncbi:unnamed protein product [Arctogadus glacialis]